MTQRSQNHWRVVQTWSDELTVGNKIMLRLLLCSASFLVGVGYGDRQDIPNPDLLLTDTPSVPADVAEPTAASTTPPAEVDPTPQPSPEPTPTPQPSPTPEPSPVTEVEPTRIRIRAVGDIVPGTNFPNNRLHPQPQVLFEEMAPILQGADVTFGNFESTLTRSPHSRKDVSRPNVFAFRNPPEYAQLLRNVGFDVLSVANNHSLDFGTQGFQDTIAHIEAAGMAAVGDKGKIVYTDINGVTIGWIGFSYGREHNTILALGSARSLVLTAQANADFVVVSYHGGAEGTSAMATRNQTEYFYGENRGNVVEFSRQMVDAGADLVLGHGPHVPRAMELYNGRLIAYSLGNFVGYRTLSTRAQLAYSLVLEVEVDENGVFQRGQIYPVLISPGGIPQRSTRSESIALIRRLTATDFPGSPLVITLDGRLQLPEQN
ncbi:CapA family protein [Spirulina major CS-329]|uniref:CapA family protein n=1 Tax=Spirulina TaxID=1154 RepID=UPI00232B3956|nr:CapA family protein [Spirulina major]MDB9495720.1 CapA family protein [Spirulina subsalsa CS-330]MDB9501988.1 CapA family protein [Spirulina major CS-329]